MKIYVRADKNDNLNQSFSKEIQNKCIDILENLLDEYAKYPIIEDKPISAHTHAYANYEELGFSGEYHMDFKSMLDSSIQVSRFISHVPIHVKVSLFSYYENEINENEIYDQLKETFSQSSNYEDNLVGVDNANQILNYASILNDVNDHFKSISENFELHVHPYSSSKKGSNRHGLETFLMYNGSSVAENIIAFGNTITHSKTIISHMESKAEKNCNVTNIEDVVSVMNTVSNHLLEISYNKNTNELSDFMYRMQQNLTRNYECVISSNNFSRDYQYLYTVASFASDWGVIESYIRDYIDSWQDVNNEIKIDSISDAANEYTLRSFIRMYL